MFRRNVKKMHQRRDIAGLINVLRTEAYTQQVRAAELSLAAIGLDAVTPLLDVFDNADEESYFIEHGRSGRLLLKITNESDEAFTTVFDSLGLYLETRCPSRAACLAALRGVWGTANRIGDRRLRPRRRLREFISERYGIEDRQIWIAVGGIDPYGLPPKNDSVTERSELEREPPGDTYQPW